MRANPLATRKSELLCKPVQFHSERNLYLADRVRQWCACVRHVSGTGSGYCSGIGVNCLINYGQPAPYFSFFYQQDASNTGELSNPTPACLCPIVIDVDGRGFHLTSAQAGVLFRDVPVSPETKMSWTDPEFHNGWLALPKNGKVEALSELFGNFSPQPPSDDPNGFRALAVYDLNGDGVIDSADAIYSQLRVWIDANHDGVAQPEELHTLAELGVERISLHYRESPRVDQFGNRFRYVAGIEDAAGPKDNRCYDVFLVPAAH
jgi:hypothetical protein